MAAALTTGSLDDAIRRALHEHVDAVLEAAIKEAVAHGTALIQQKFDEGKAQFVLALLSHYDVYRDLNRVVITVNDKSKSDG